MQTEPGLPRQPPECIQQNSRAFFLCNAVLKNPKSCSTPSLVVKPRQATYTPPNSRQTLLAAAANTAYVPWRACLRSAYAAMTLPPSAAEDATERLFSRQIKSSRAAHSPGGQVCISKSPARAKTGACLASSKLGSPWQQTLLLDLACRIVKALRRGDGGCMTRVPCPQSASGCLPTGGRDQTSSGAQDQSAGCPDNRRNRRQDLQSRRHLH